MEAELKKIKRMQKQLAAAFVLFIILIVAFLAVYDLSPGKEALALSGNYSKADKSQLTFEDWNLLDDDFLAKSGDGAINGRLQVTGGIKLGGAEGSLFDVDKIIGHGDLFLMGNLSESDPVYIGGSQINFYTGKIQRLSIESDGDIKAVYNRWNNDCEVKTVSNPPGSAECPQGKFVTKVNFFADEQNKFTITCCGL